MLFGFCHRGHWTIHWWPSEHNVNTKLPLISGEIDRWITHRHNFAPLPQILNTGTNLPEDLPVISMGGPSEDTEDFILAYTFAVHKNVEAEIRSKVVFMDALQGEYNPAGLRDL